MRLNIKAIANIATVPQGWHKPFTEPSLDSKQGCETHPALPVEEPPRQARLPSSMYTQYGMMRVFSWRSFVRSATGLSSVGVIITQSGSAATAGAIEPRVILWGVWHT